MFDIPTEDKLPSDDSVELTFFRPSDAAAMRDMDADPEHRRRFDFPEEFIPSLAHSEKVIASWTGAREEGQFVFAVRARASGELLGGCEIWLLGDSVANVSYWTIPRHRAHGVASRAVALLYELVRTRPGIRRLEIIVDPDNIASRRVAMSAGFHEVGMREGRVLHIKDLGPLTPDPSNKTIR